MYALEVREIIIYVYTKMGGAGGVRTRFGR